MELKFDKYHGAGNDFILINCLKDKVFLSDEQIRFLCHRRLGIGADGLIMLLPFEGKDFRMKYFNADGLEGSMCGNGGRTVAAYAFRNQISASKIQFQAFDGEHDAEILSDKGIDFEVLLTMKDVEAITYDDHHLIINTGSPHYVTKVDNLADFDVVTEGRKIRYDSKLSSNGLNVNFLERNDEGIFLRTYERGVEDETLSCGTGVTAAAIASSLWFGQNEYWIQTPGGRLHVQFSRNGNKFSNIVLTGPVKYVYNGSIQL